MIPAEEEPKPDHHCGDDLKGELPLLPLGKLAVGLGDGSCAFGCCPGAIVTLLSAEDPLGKRLDAAFTERLEARNAAMGGDLVLVVETV